MKQLSIYNLEFPPYIEELNIGDYKFKRVSNYEESFGKLMHLVNSSGSESATKVQTGSHQITATVEIPDSETSAVLPWADKDAKQLLDVLLLLTIFTGRNVFIKEWEEDEGVAIIQDHRQHQWGGQLILSIEYESMWKHRDAGILYSEQDIKGKQVFDYNQVNVGFEKSLNKILNLISTKKWQEKYSNGYFLFLYKDAVQRQILEKSFLSCWTIWEQIFSLENNGWLPNEDILKIGGDRKIAYILNKYFGINIDENGRRNIRRITKSRNKLVHFGKKMENVSTQEKEMFVRLTEQLIAIILGLAPSNAFNSFERLDDFLIK